GPVAEPGEVHGPEGYGVDRGGGVADDEVEEVRLDHEVADEEFDRERGDEAAQEPQAEPVHEPVRGPAHRRQALEGDDDQREHPRDGPQDRVDPGAGPLPLVVGDHAGDLGFERHRGVADHRVPHGRVGERPAGRLLRHGRVLRVAGRRGGRRSWRS
ncbi:hypothetical protein ADL26_08330, partial [Thermoactinomyces vulgaris]